MHLDASLYEAARLEYNGLERAPDGGLQGVAMEISSGIGLPAFWSEDARIFLRPGERDVRPTRVAARRRRAALRVIRVLAASRSAI